MQSRAKAKKLSVRKNSDQDPVTDEVADQVADEILVGFGHFGQALLSQLFRSVVYSSFEQTTPKKVISKKPRIALYSRLPKAPKDLNLKLRWIRQQSVAIIQAVAQQHPKKKIETFLTQHLVINHQYPQDDFFKQATVIHLCFRPKDLASFMEEHESLKNFKGAIISWLGTVTYKQLKQMFPMARILRAMSSVLLAQETVAMGFLGEKLDLNWWQRRTPAPIKPFLFCYPVLQEHLFLSHVPLWGSFSALMAQQIIMLAEHLHQYSIFNKSQPAKLEQQLIHLFMVSLKSAASYANANQKGLVTLISEVATPGGLTEKMIKFHQHQTARLPQGPWPLVPLDQL